jgi:hypothetical protein
MMHSNDFVVAIMVNDSALLESKGGVVAIPFGTEYTIRLRNKHKDRRALAKVFIDEENISGGGVIVPADKFVDLETSPANPGRKFKVVSAESSEAVEAGKNNKSDDSNGVIRVEWQLEKEWKATQVVYVDRPVPYYPWRSRRPYDNQPYFDSRLCDTEQSLNCNTLDESPKSSNFAGEVPTSRRLKEACTVEGGRSNQTFYDAYIDTESVTTTIRIVIRGFKGIEGASSTAKHCENCGASRKFRKAKFCWDCGKVLPKYGACV